MGSETTWGKQKFKQRRCLTRTPRHRGATGWRYRRYKAGWLECHQCDYKCRERRLLHSHMLQEHNDTIYLCLHCEEMFKDKNLLQEHKRRVHGDVKLIWPEYEYTKASSIVNKLEREHSALVEACNSCDHKADNFFKLNEHIAKEHPGEELHCKLKPFQRALWSTQLWTIRNQFQHPVLNEILQRNKVQSVQHHCNWESSLQSHYVKHHSGPKGFECGDCRFTNRWETSFNRHIHRRETHWTRMLSTQCNHCGIQFTCRRDIKRHVKANHKEPI